MSQDYAPPTPTMHPGPAREALKEVLALAVGGASLQDILDALARAANGLTTEASPAAIFLLSADRRTLHLAASAGVPRDYLEAVEGCPVGLDRPACGRAVLIGEPVIARDVTQDPSWRPFLAVAQANGVRACWAFPLHVPDGRVIGTLALYHGRPAVPDATLLDEIRYFANIVSLAVDRHLLAGEHRRVESATRAELDEAIATSDRQKRLYETILAATPDLMYVFDLDHRFTYANEVLLRMWGKTWDEAIGKNCLELGYEPWHAEMHDREIEQVKATGRPIRGEVPFTGTFGRRIYDYIFVPVFGVDGKVEAVAGTTRDVTVRKEFEEALRHAQMRAESALAVARLGTFDWHLASGRVECSPRTREIYGLSDGEGHDQQDYFSRILPEDLARVEQEIAQSMQGDGRLRSGYRIRLPDGTIRHIVSMSMCVRDARGEPERQIGVFADDTERHLAEQELLAASRRKDEFLAMLAHELRNPLAPIAAAAELMSIGSFDAERLRRTSEVIARQVKHMTSLVDDLLDVSRVTRGLVVLDKATLDLRRIVDDAVEQARPLLESRRHRLALALPPEPAFVLGDAKRLVQVLTNILTNAAKYTPAGGHVALSVEVGDADIAIAIEDDGIGMTPDMTVRAFDLFAQADRTADRSQGGLGLGLALVKSLVALHGGSVVASSDGPGKGSRFVVTLPRATVAACDDAPAGQPATPTASGLSVLVVDDNADAADMLALLLESAGHRVTIESDPFRALTRIRDDAPDACLLDIGLPGLDGNALAMRVRLDAGQSAPMLIAVTGYGRQEDRRQTAMAGFDHHFVKPVDAPRLLALLADLATARGR